MNNKTIKSIITMVLIAGGIYFFLGVIYNGVTQIYIDKGIEQGMVEGIKQGKEQGGTEMENKVNKNISDSILANGKMTATIPYKDKDGAEQQLQVLIINAGLLNQEE